VKPLVRAIDRPTMAGASISTVENVLDRQVDVDSLSLACDLDAVTQGTHGAMGPAASTVLGNVLVERLGQEAGAVDVAPVPLVREGLGFQSVLRKGLEAPVLDCWTS